MSKAKAVKDRFKRMRSKVKDVFDDVQQCVEKRRREVNSLITTEETAALALLTELDKERAAMRSHAATLEQLVASAPDDDLLEMLSKLTSRLSELELQTGTTEKIEAIADVTFDSPKLHELKAAIAELGSCFFYSFF